ncbi:MAG TPA: MraY family glycosyltransferase, partial [Pyrinomonadaceae bacterium]|nr:MraY family glycosyltransferase [Pyrinomonadaceae bacterium]
MIILHLFIALIVLALSCRVTRTLSLPASRLRLLDHPNERSLHAKPVPKTGGLAILFSFAAGLATETLLKISGLTGSRGFVVSNLLIIAMLFFIAVVSLVDDWKELAPAIRFLVHIAAACGVVFGAGMIISSLMLPLVGSYQLGVLGAPLTIFWLVWMTNLYNFMDGMDGFAGGMSVVGFGFLSMIAWAGGYYFMAL